MDVKRHYLPPNKNVTPCNLLAWNTNHPRYTRDVEDVTCEACKKIINNIKE